MTKINSLKLSTVFGFVSGCSSGGDSVTFNSPQSESSDVEVDDIDNGVLEDDENQCINGRYSFSTNNDGKVHFDASFDGQGNVLYHLSFHSTGTYTVSGDNVSFTGPFGANFATAEFVWTITSSDRNCLAQQFRGSSLSGAGMTATLR